MLVGHLFRHFIFSKRAGSLVKRISWLSMIGISISVTAFLVVLFVMNGMNATIKKRILGLEPHLYVQAAGVSSAASLEAHPVFQRLKEHPENKAYVYETQDVIIRSQDGQFRGGVARGVTRESLGYFIEQLQQMERNQRQSDSPAYFWDPQDVPEEGEIIMGVDLAQSLGVFEGDYVTLVSPSGLLLPPGETPKFERLRVKRIVTTSLADIDAQYIFYQRGKALNSLVNEGMRKLGIEVWLPAGVSVDTVKDDLLKFEDVSVETWMDRNSALLYALKLEKLTIGTFLGLAGMIAASSILTVLALLLSQKRRDIAILRTIGFSAKQTVRTFTQLGFILASVGVLTGVILGTGISLYIEANPIQLAASQIYYDPSIPALVDFTLVFGVLIVSGLIAWFGSYIPARTASEVQPSDALRMK
ncbi:lipoprotein-releasing protein [Bdellovibrio bacteriovorus]|uniref:Lipoprotein-releasing protein n=1 Tax=Bdellovibrio bacteriovorus TaxID=959 RepID=A0A161PSF2_BDEBC|nr:FtsX-like permease family protein [Bdellovibrio bacteriovorus]KYG65438.1 lipoprotein-releasing protein [Bdellovibrio bacteriovorus]